MLNWNGKNAKLLSWGDKTIQRAYLGDKLVFENAPTYTINVMIDPAGSGTVTGAGQYKEGQAVTLVAEPEEGYKFSGWQENGQTVSTDTAYTFIITESRTLVAVFAVSSRLPDGYTEVEYVKTSSDAFIDSEGTAGLYNLISDKFVSSSIGPITPGPAI